MITTLYCWVLKGGDGYQFWLRDQLRQQELMLFQYWQLQKPLMD